MNRPTQQRTMQHMIVNEETLTDGSKVYNVVGFDGDKRITIRATDEQFADEIADLINDGSCGFDIEVAP